MVVAVFGANGKIGSQVVEQLLERGHSVRALIHSTNTLPTDAKLTVISGDVKDKNVVTEVITGADVIVSALGSWGTKSKDIVSSGMASIVPVAESLGVTRVISLTGSDAWLPNESAGFLRSTMHTFLGVAAKKILTDGEKHVAILYASSLDWITVRSPVMRSSGSTTYRLSSTPNKPWHTIHRVAVASALVGLVEKPEYSKQAPFIWPTR